MALGMELLRECYSPLHNTSEGTEVRALQGCWRNGHQRPVLKHGPRSQALGRVFGCKTRTRNESERRCVFRCFFVCFCCFRMVLSKSLTAWTRKMVNYACIG